MMCRAKYNDDWVGTKRSCQPDSKVSAPLTVTLQLTHIHTHSCISCGTLW